MNYKARELRSALEAKGFSLERKTTDDIFYFYHERKRTQVHTKIKRQLFLDTGVQLADFIKCPMSHEAYIAHLQAKGIVEKTS